MAIHIVLTGANTFSNWKQKNIACASIRSTPHAILVCIRTLLNDLAIFLIFNSVIDLARHIHMHLYHIASWHQQNIHIISHKNMPIHSSLKFSDFLYTQPSFPLIFWNSDPRGTSVCHLFQNNVFKTFYWNYLQ